MATIAGFEHAPQTRNATKEASVLPAPLRCDQRPHQH